MKKLTRRSFLKAAGLGAGTLALTTAVGSREAKASQDLFPDGVGLLIDTTRCIGCRSCEAACNKQHSLKAPSRPFTDRSVLEERRRTNAEAFTVVNRYDNPKPDEQTLYPQINRKMQCMHCLDAACASACPVGAMHKTSNGVTVYDDTKCIGCRYCMVACPFDIPTFTWDKGLLDQAVIRKCNLCYDRTSQGQPTACAEACPVKAIVFGKRRDLLAEAEARIASQPGLYVNHVYGKDEAGGTSVTYITQAPAEKLGLPKLTSDPLPALSETVMGGTIPFALVWGGTLVGVYKVAQLRDHRMSSRFDEEEVNHDDEPR